MSRSLAVICTLAVGGLVALQPSANAALARHVSNLGAALISLAISLTIIGLVLVVLGHPSRLSGLSAFRPEYALGGLGGAAVVAVGLVTVRWLGAGGVNALMVSGQLVIAVVADRLGWLGLTRVGLTPGRWLGLALVIGGTVLITRR